MNDTLQWIIDLDNSPEYEIENRNNTISSELFRRAIFRKLNAMIFNDDLDAMKSIQIFYPSIQTKRDAMRQLNRLHYVPMNHDARTCDCARCVEIRDGFESIKKYFGFDDLKL